MSTGLHPGAIFPDFELPDEEGNMHRLSEVQGKNPMVVQLGRGEHCPRERQHHRELLRFHEWCATALTELVTILPNDLHDVLKLKMTTGAHWLFLSDRDLEVQQTFDIDEYVDNHPAAATVPHTVILSPGLVIEKVYVGFWFWGRPSVYDLWTDLREVRRKIDANFDPTLPDVREAWFAAHPEVTPRPRREPKTNGRAPVRQKTTAKA
jgi:peroxiredoxin